MRDQPSWRTFEHEVGLLVEAFGYTVEVTPASNDFGADVIAIKRGRRVAIQCKFYASGRIGHPVIISLSGARAYYKADEAICFSTSAFTKQAHETAQRLSIHLADKKRIIDLCREVSFTLPNLTCLLVGDQQFLLREEGLKTIGRDESCDIRLQSDLVSRAHCRLLRQGGTLMVEDLKSTNGTLLNDRRLVAPVALNYGDILSFGDLRATVVMQSVGFQT